MIKIKCKMKIFILFLTFYVVLCLSGCGKSSYDFAYEAVDEVSQEFVSQNAQEEDTACQTIYVHVCGAVEKPGVYELESESRLYQVIALAGGFSEDANQNSLNLAQFLQDGQQVYVYTLQETEAMQTVPVEASTGMNSTLININTASVQQLKNLPGIGESKAQAIVAYREKQGSFSSIEQIKKVEGIKDGLFQKIKDSITVN